jgi:hypothetical protein
MEGFIPSKLAEAMGRYGGSPEGGEADKQASGSSLNRNSSSSTETTVSEEGDFFDEGESVASSSTSVDDLYIGAGGEPLIVDEESDKIEKEEDGKLAPQDDKAVEDSGTYGSMEGESFDHSECLKMAGMLV